MAHYRFELGIDWNEIEIDGASYLPWGFLNEDLAAVASTMAPAVNADDLITFYVFDITEQSAAALGGVSLDCTSIQADTSSIPIVNAGPLAAGPAGTVSLYFGGTPPCWISPAMPASTLVGGIPSAPTRFLMSFVAQASVVDTERIFGVDPEMAVGPDGVCPVCLPPVYPPEPVAAGANRTISR